MGVASKMPIPTSSSWLNTVEGVSTKLTRRRLKHGVFRSVGDQQDAIDRSIAEHDISEAKPFVWRVDPDDIIAARNRGFQKLDSIREPTRRRLGTCRLASRAPR